MLKPVSTAVLRGKGVRSWTNRYAGCVFSIFPGSLNSQVSSKVRLIIQRHCMLRTSNAASQAAQPALTLHPRWLCRQSTRPYNHRAGHRLHASATPRVLDMDGSREVPQCTITFRLIAGEAETVINTVRLQTNWVTMLNETMVGVTTNALLLDWSFEVCTE
jgi:hypothetical protein